MSGDSPGGLPGRYDANGRTITLDIEIDSNPQMGLAALIDGVVRDLLHQANFDLANRQELVELAVTGTGLGMLRNNIDLVKKRTTSWDSTQWELFPRPLLDRPSLAYANAITAWARDDSTPEWANDLPSDLKRPMRKSLNFLFKTNDSFFRPQANRSLLSQSAGEWWTLAASASVSKQVIAIRHLEFDSELNDQRESLLLEKLRSSNLTIVLNAIAATERMAFHRQVVASESVIRELRTLVDHREEEVRAKAMYALAGLGQLDDASVETAALMLEDHRRHIVFAGVNALSTLNSVPDHILPSIDQRLVRAIRDCDYESIDIFVEAYRRWFDEPQSKLEGLLQDDPEHLPGVLETLHKARDQQLQIRSSA